MSFIIIGVQGGAECAIVCMYENGDNLVFESREEAEVEARDCQDGRVVEI